MSQSAAPVTLVGDKTTETIWPDVLVTGGGLDGVSPRLRVDVGQTGFFAKREFRTLREFNLTAGQVLIIRATLAVNTIIWGVNLTLLDGDVRLENVSGGTPGGTFTNLPTFSRNGMTEAPPANVPANVYAAGGTLTGGTVTDVFLLKTAGNSNFASAVGAEQNDERGAPPGTYYYRLTAAANSVGVIKFRWEERP